MIFGVLDWSDQPAADHSLQKALANSHPNLRSGLFLHETPRLALAGNRPAEFFCSRSSGLADGGGGFRSRTSESSWLLTDAAASAGAFHPDGRNESAIDSTEAAQQTARRFRGDYALAWWDVSRGALVLIRDAMGLQPLFFFHEPPRVMFSSSLAALRAAFPLENEVDQLFIAHALCHDMQVRMRTAWQAFRRVPAGSYVSLSPVHPSVDAGRWWSPGLESTPMSPPGGDWPAALRQRLMSAVADHVPEAPGSPIASFLSGGLDSSSIVGAIGAVVRDRGSTSSINTLSFRFPGLQGVERRRSEETRFQVAVNEFVGATSHVIRADLSSPLDGIDDFLTAIGEPWATPNRYLHHAGLRLASAMEASVVFDGIDGDSAIGYGLELFEELVRSFSWLRFVREARNLARVAPGGRRRAFRILSRYALPGLRRTSWLRKREIQRGQVELDSRMQLLSSALRERDDVRRNLQARSVIPAEGPDSFAHQHAAALQFEIFELATSQLQLLAMAYGLRMAFPFFDRDLLELSLVIPLDQKFRNGWPRSVLREAVAGLVPEEVRWRWGKSDLAPQFYKGLMTTDRPFARSLLRRSEPALEPYVDIDALRGVSDDLFEREDRSQAMPLMAVVTLARWLELRDEGAV